MQWSGSRLRHSRRSQRKPRRSQPGNRVAGTFDLPKRNPQRRPSDVGSLRVAVKRVRYFNMIEKRSRLLAGLIVGTLAFSLAAPSFAEPARRPSESAKEQSTEANRLPADVTTDHVVELPDRTLRFKATAGSIPINNAEGKLQAELAYIAYVRPDAEAASRPLTFVFNGGPGASSAYMQLGAIGPWRLPLDNITPSTVPVVTPNADTWLDFTDLVFVDPVGTGYSRFINTSDDVRKHFWSVDGDIDV